MDVERRDRAAAAIAAVALVLGIGTLMLWRHSPMATLGLDEAGRLVIASVEPGGPAARDGLVAGMLVADANNVRVIRFPEYVYPAEPSLDPITGEVDEGPIGVDPPAPEFAELPSEALERLMVVRIESLSAIQPWDLERGTVENGWYVSGTYDDRLWWTSEAAPAVVMGTALWVLIGWWLASGRAGGSLRRLAVPLATATAIAFLVRPLALTGSPALAALAGILVGLAMLPLADGLAEAIEEPTERRLVRQAALLCTAATALLAVAAAGAFPSFDVGLAQLGLAGVIPLLPGLAAAGPVRESGLRGGSSGRLLESTEYAVLGATPLVALASTSSPLAFPLVLWFALVLLAGRFTIRPLARLASRATLQRDLVVAATEAERARVAADIHDDALQELTLLVHRLDSAGDAEGAELARTVSDRLRAICGDLRLPILDDLGVGPALDWLVLRIERLAGGEVRLERADPSRPPADVELAFFRVAQEALANAVKHGRPPIVVRYTTTASGASLSIDDSGVGIEAVADQAERPGHFGLLNMQQRAEAIGAILDVRRWPNGGTHVALEWRAP